MQEKIYECACGKAFKDAGNYTKHIKRFCKLNTELSTCVYCQKTMLPDLLVKHIRRCIYNPTRERFPSELKPIIRTPENRNPRYCKFCERYCKNLQSESNHLRYCRKNPANISRYENIDLIKQLKTHSASKQRQSGRANTPEAEALRRQRISETMKKNPKAGGKRERSGRGKKGWYKGYFCDSTYELVYVIYNIDHGIPFKRCDLEYIYSYNDQLHRYYPDFELADGSLVEIKGYHTQLVDIKLSAVTDRQIKILYEKDLKYAFDWVKDHYTYKQLSDLYE